ncbi:hypothetical protein ERJ75_000826000 [Trypanosoma vivax]|nr:hypothetical protein ERJ75_000826000 [Trypanosoma vivax]
MEGDGALGPAACSEKELRVTGGLKDLEAPQLENVERFIVDKVELQPGDLEPLRACTRLVSLQLEECEGVCDLSPVAALTLLEDVHVEVWGEIKNFSAITALPCLKRLHVIYETTDAGVAQELRHVRTLEEVSLRHVPAADAAEGIAGLPLLRSLSLGATDLTDDRLRYLTACKRLKSLLLNGCSGLTDVSPLAEIPSLEQVEVHWCDTVDRGVGEMGRLPRLCTLELTDLLIKGEDLVGLRASKTLKRLVIGQCINVTDVSHVAEIATLEELVVHPPREIRVVGVGPLGRLPRLRKLDVDRASLSETDVRELGASGSIEELELSAVNSLIDLSHLSRSTSLLVLGVGGLKCSVCGVGAVCGLPRLREFSLCHVRVNEDPVQTVGPSASLVKLSLVKCTGITDVSFVAHFHALEVVVIDQCKSICRGVGALGGLPRLRELQLRNIDVTTESLQSLSASKGLVRLEIERCRSLVDLSVIGKIVTLQELTLVGWSKELAGVEALTELPCLRHIALKDVPGTKDVLEALRAKGVQLLP